MLDAEADGEALGYELRPGLQENGVRVVGRVPRGDDDRVRLDDRTTMPVMVVSLVVKVRGEEVYAFASALAYVESVDSGAKPEVDEARRRQGVAHVLEDAHEGVRPEVGRPTDENGLGGPVVDESLQDLARREFVPANSRREFSVAPGPGAALAVGEVRVRVQDPSMDQLADVGPAALDALAALQQRHRHAVGRQLLRAEQTRGTRAHDNHLPLRVRADHHLRRGRRSSSFFQDSLLQLAAFRLQSTPRVAVVVHVDVDDVDPSGLPEALPRIHGLPDDPRDVEGDVAPLPAEAPSRRVDQRLRYDARRRTRPRVLRHRHRHVEDPVRRPQRPPKLLLLLLLREEASSGEGTKPEFPSHL
mmetsp:Transcript_20394/g.65696  ORF Transcript_20394/g.65696 Transcript_20394/m.65696 type:complete len:360 (-) Transcript_20394:8-1087(-)